MNYHEITDLYRQIGRQFRKLGADRVYLVHSKALDSSQYAIEMEIIIDTAGNKDLFIKEAVKEWPMVKMDISLAEDCCERLQELDEDAIIL